MSIIVSDFDGTITKEDSLYNFFDRYADKKWLEVEELWKEGKIGSKECLIKEFELVKGLSEELIDEFINEIEVDKYFVKFSELCKKNKVDFLVVSDGVDYFINKILEKNDIKDVKVITNHGEFIKGKFTLTFPNCNKDCKNDSGTCKCKVIYDLSKEYNKIYYIGDGTSDFCVANKVDCLFAKSKLIDYSKANNINYQPFESYKDIITALF